MEIWVEIFWQGRVPINLTVLSLKIISLYFLCHHFVWHAPHVTTTPFSYHVFSTNPLHPCIWVTNQVFRFAKKAGASYINKPKMRHYVHCYALHCLDQEASNALRRAFKERGENVGAWRQACYKPLVSIAARQGWDIDAIFNAHPRLAIWYVPTKLRQLCHAERNGAAIVAASSSVSGGPDHMGF